MPKTRLISPGSIPNHRLLKNLRLNDNYISNDGGDEGIRISDAGKVGIGIDDNTSHMLEIFDNNSSQLKLSNDADSYCTIEVADGSNTTITVAETGLLQCTVPGELKLYAGNETEVRGTFLWLNPTTKTASTTTDYSMLITETLNLGSGEAGGSDVHFGLKYTQTQTDLTGWNSVYLMYLDGGSGKILSIDGNANLTLSNNRKVVFGDAGEYIAGDGTDLDIVSSNDATIDADGDIILDANGGQVSIKDNGANHFLFDCDSTRFRIYDDTNSSDHFTISVGAEGVTTMATIDADTAVGHLNIVPDGDLILNPASHKTIINATDGLYFDGGGDTYIAEASPDLLMFRVGDAQLMNLRENGDEGNNVYFKNASAGFTLASGTFSDDSIIGSGGTDDTHIDFRSTNKVSLALTNDITNLNLIFPPVSGNFLLILTYDGDHDITNWKVYESDASAATGDADVLWAGGAAPVLTDSGSDIVSFFWNNAGQKCYGVASLSFSN